MTRVWSFCNVLPVGPIIITVLVMLGLWATYRDYEQRYQDSFRAISQVQLTSAVPEDSDSVAASALSSSQPRPAPTATVVDADNVTYVFCLMITVRPGDPLAPPKVTIQPMREALHGDRATAAFQP